MPNGSQRKPRVIVVDDDAPTRDLMRRLLGNDFEVLMAESGTTLRRMTRSLSPCDTVILMDLDLGPGSETGIDLTSELRNDDRWSRVPIIAISAHADSHVRKIARRAGVDVYHEKPLRLRLLLTEIRERLGRRDDAEAVD